MIASYLIPSGVLFFQIYFWAYSQASIWTAGMILIDVGFHFPLLCVVSVGRADNFGRFREGSGEGQKALKLGLAWIHWASWPE